MNRFFLRRVAPTRLFSLLLLSGVSFGAHAQDAAAPAQTAQTEPATTAQAPEEDTSKAPARFNVVLEAPKALQAFLLRHLDLQRFRTLSDLDSSELDRLLLAAPDNLRDLLGTQGYFSPEIKVSRKAAAGSAADAPVLGEVNIVVTPGPVTKVGSSNLYFQGDITDADAAADQRTEMLTASQGAVGKEFTQARWDLAKTETLRLLTKQRYPRGRIVNSLSDVDSAQHSANWYLELDSGPPVQIGEVKVEGGERYNIATAERLARLAGLTPGADYSLEKLQDAQQKISDSGYYSSVFAYVDLDQEGPARDTAAPVIVQVKESQPQKVVVGLGGSTDSGARLSIEHSHLQLPLLGWRATSKLQLETDDQLISTDWVAPIEDDGWHWLAGGKIASEVDDETTTSGLRLSTGKAQESTVLDRSYYVQYDRAKTVNTESELASSDGYESALTVNYGWTWRRFDNVPFPDSGYGFGLTLGAGVTLGTERDPFTTTHARWLGYWPLGEALDTTLLAGLRRGEQRPAESRSPNGRLALRLEGAAVLASDDAPIPDTQLFLTGGDKTVRGYGLRDIGVEESDGTVTAGRYLAVASFEWQRPIYSDGQRTQWESVVFIDAGAVADSPSDLAAKVGVGVGARYNSPVGPLQIDLAYGVDTQEVRVHLNVGFTF